MDLITELENDIALAVMFEKDRDNDGRDLRDLIANVHTALRPLADAPRRNTPPEKEQKKAHSQ